MLQKHAFSSAREQVQPPSLNRDGLAETLKLFRRNRRGLLAWVATCVLVALLYVSLAAPEFVATAEVLLDTRPLQRGLDLPSPLTSVDNAQVESQAQIARSEQVLRYVFNELDFRHDPEFDKTNPTGDPVADRRDATAAFQNFADRVVARRLGQSLVLEISFRSVDPVRAARVANALAYSFILYQIRVRELEVRRSGDWLQSRIDEVNAQEKAIAEAVHEGRTPSAAPTASPAQVISEATEPLARSSPRKGLTLVAAVAFALLTGLGGVSVRHGLDRRIRSGRQISDDFKLEYLGSAPYDHDLGFGSVASLKEILFVDPQSGFRRSMEAIASALVNARRGKADAPIVVGVVACHRYAGATTIATALAMRIAARGYVTGLAETTVVGAKAPHNQELAPLSGASGASVALALRSFQLVEFDAVCALRRRADPQRLGQKAVNAEKLYAVDQVFIDFSAFVETADALSYADLLDGMIIVVECGKTSSEQLSEAIHAIRLTDTPILGAVINKAPL